MRGPDFRFGAHETRAEQPPDVHPCPREIECSWGFARGFRAAPCRDAPAGTGRDGEEAHLGFEWLRAPLVGSNWLYELSAQQRAHRANWVPRERSATHRPQTRHLAKMAPLEPFVEAGELRLREKDHANVTVTRTCSINSLTVRQSLDWPLWSGHFPTSSASAGRKGSSGLLVGRAEARAVYVPRTKLPLAPTKRRA